MNLSSSLKLFHSLPTSDSQDRLTEQKKHRVRSQGCLRLCPCAAVRLHTLTQSNLEFHFPYGRTKSPDTHQHEFLSFHWHINMSAELFWGLYLIWELFPNLSDLTQVVRVAYRRYCQLPSMPTKVVKHTWQRVDQIWNRFLKERNNKLTFGILIFHITRTRNQN